MRRYIRSIAQLPTWLIAGLIAYVPFHAFVSVWLSSFIGHYTLLRLLPEFVLAVLAVWAVVRLCRSAELRRRTTRTALGKVIITYLAVIVMFSIVAYFRETASTQAFWYGVLLTARPVVWFAVVWVFALEHSWLKQHWQRLVLVPLVIVASFAVLQFFVLPPDFLSHFGYEKGVTITPAQTLNQDTDTIRAQSTLRGPNPLGAYLAVGVVIALVASLTAGRKAGLIVLTSLGLFLTFSRSAWLGLGVSLVLFAATALKTEYRRRFFLTGAVLAALVVGGLWVFRDNPGVQNLVFHSNETSTATETSNEAHEIALRESIDDIVAHPIGHGPGTAGPASVHNSYADARNSESYFLNLGQEYGWIGLGLFILLLVVLAICLHRLKTPLGSMVSVTLLGLVFTNLFSYAWADTTLVYLWWGLAAIALASGSIAATDTKFDTLLRHRLNPLRRAYRRHKPSRKGFVQFAYFNLGGAMFFTAGYASFAVLYGLLSWYWLYAKLLADLIGWTLNYLIQHYLAFGSSARKQGHKSALMKFIPFSLLNLLIDYGIVAGLNWLGVTPFIGLIVSALFFTVWKWLGYKHWVFSAKPSETKSR